MPSREERFWRKVTKTDGCWYWTGAHAVQGYGRLRTRQNGRNRQDLAHRISYELHIGPIPPGKSVCHTCDNPPCVNPAHLWLGSQAENNADRDAKGRQRAPRRLTDYIVSEIRRRRANGELLRVLAADYGTTTGYVSAIATRRWWKHLP
jgi:hypothetical protein